MFQDEKLMREIVAWKCIYKIICNEDMLVPFMLSRQLSSCVGLTLVSIHFFEREKRDSFRCGLPRLITLNVVYPQSSLHCVVLK